MPDHASSGFALVMVIWAVALMSLLATAIIMASHYRLEATANIVENAKAERLAEAAIALARLALASHMSARGMERDGSNAALASNAPALCEMPTGAIAAILIEDEGGKVDLNFASTDMLAALLNGLGVSPDEAMVLAGNIRQYASRAPFETIMELDQVPGIGRALFERLLPFATVSSRHAGIDPALASATLSTLLIEPRFATPSRRTSFLIDAEIMTPTGSYFAREAIVEWHAGNAALATREWRRGRGRFRQMLRAGPGRPLSTCEAATVERLLWP